MDKAEGLYARASDKLRERLYLLKGQWFLKSDACEVCSVNNRPDHADYRYAIGQVLYKWTHELKEPLLEQRDKRYWVIERDFKVVKPGSSSDMNKVDIAWPRGIDDNSTFGFDESIVIHKGDVVGLGGEGSKGKSLFCLSLAVENMDKLPTTIIISENIHLLDERLSHFDWVDLYNPDGDWWFEVLEAHQPEEFLDIIRARKDNFVIIDWLSITKESYLVADFYKAASERIDGGVVFVTQQKRSYKDWVVGGEGAYDYTAAFFLLQAGKIRVVKVKVPGYYDPTDKMYRFKIGKSGSRFYDIAEVYDCPQCKGKKYYQGEKCGRCYGLGYLDVMEKY